MTMRLPMLALATIIATAGTALAQQESSKENKKLRLHYERSGNGRSHIIDRSFENQVKLDAFLDSLNATSSSDNDRVRITVGSEGDSNFNQENQEFSIQSFRSPKTPTPPRTPKAPRAPRAYRDDEPLARGEWEKFDKEMERFGQNMERWGKNFGDQFSQSFRYYAPNRNSLPKLSPQVFTWEGTSSSKTVRSLNVYPNRPFNQTLNLRFTSPTKGDVTIMVTDVKGREVAKETVKDFEGEYVGQITLSKKAEKGTYFVTVTQGEDGTVKRVVIE
ncbi:T9SS type A sorting domain-containing protein [Siphonobacter sp. SORGH_AS_1065]|uniref:T9SS type A sorting domain-containing protein n=1 Tax=Siphonobacter sp. SORGH_AS_1065 TaxID=3041795 RepID=UPI002781571E|nr:T9SS type A sorting domain-containing protein [Siphonobacter sp. SORGH_AS_1065]MDQ1087982.1 hypothetical protein [Siphonobacter sp. SORGH_AS_1065]